MVTRTLPLAKQWAASLIRVYQRRISPHKGYACPYRMLHRRNSCSGHALHILQRVGISRLFPLLRRRFHRCAQAGAILRAARSGSAPQTLTHTDPDSCTSPESCPIDIDFDILGCAGEALLEILLRLICGS